MHSHMHIGDKIAGLILWKTHLGVPQGSVPAPLLQLNIYINKTLLSDDADGCLYVGPIFQAIATNDRVSAHETKFMKPKNVNMI